MTYRETLINEMIKNGTNNCEEDVILDHMDLLYNMAASLDYKYGDKLTMGPAAAKEVALDNFRELCRYANSIEGKRELYNQFSFYEGVISYVWEELLNVYKFEGITDELLNEVAMESVNENQFPVMDKTIGENIELIKEHLKEIDNLLANIEVYDGEVEEVEG